MTPAEALHPDVRGLDEIVVLYVDSTGLDSARAIDIYNTSVILKLVLAIESEHRHPVRADNEVMTITSYPTQSMLNKILNMIDATMKTGAGTSTVVGILDSPTKEEKKELSDNKT